MCTCTYICRLFIHAHMYTHSIMYSFTTYVHAVTIQFNDMYMYMYMGADCYFSKPGWLLYFALCGCVL